MVPATEQELRQTLNGEAIGSFAQPMTDIVSGRLVGFDCTLRHLSPGSPSHDAEDLLPHIHTPKLCWQLVERLLSDVGATAASWPEDLALSVDLPGSLMADMTMPRRVASLAADARLPAVRLLVGLDERSAARDHEATKAACLQFRSCGIRTVLAGFDGRHCTLAQLSELALDRLRIDSALVGTMQSCFQGYRVVASALGLGRGLDLTTIAGGVVDSTQAGMLSMLGCDIGQGDHFGAAVPLQQALAHQQMVSPVSQ